MEIRRGLPGDPDDTHSRYIEAAIDGMTVGCLYLPNGNPAPGPRFDYKLRWFDRLAKHAKNLDRGPVRSRKQGIPVAQQCEVLSALGDIALDDLGGPSLHVHVVLGLSNGSTRRGHLLEGLVRPTPEVTLVETPAHLRRMSTRNSGLPYRPCRLVLIAPEKDLADNGRGLALIHRQVFRNASVSS